MFNNFLLYLAITAFITQSKAQNIIIRGVVKDSLTNETLIASFVVHDDKVYDADANGYFEIKLTSQSSKNIEIHNLGYKNLIVNTNDLYTDQINTIFLSPLIKHEIVIIGISEKNGQQSGGNFKLSGREIKKLSSLAGEADIMQALHFKSGFQPITEGFSGVVARGGLPDQNLLLLNGVRIYNYTHLFGFLPFINGDMIKDVTISKSGFSGKYGGRSSSVIDISMFDGNNKKTEIDLTAGILMSKLTLKIPLIKDKWGINIAGRISNLGLVNLFSGIDYENKENASSVGINIYDYTISSKYNISSSSSISAFGLLSLDKIKIKEKFNFTKEDISSNGWENNVFGLKFSKIFENSLTFDASFGYLNYENFQLSESKIDKISTSKTSIVSGLDEKSISMTITKYHSNSFFASFGIGYYSTAFDFINFYDLEDTIQVNPERLDNPYGYFSATWKWKNWTTQINTRYDMFILQKSKGIIQPRLSFSYKYNDKFTFSGALDITSQSAFQIPTFNSAGPMDIWVPMNFNNLINCSKQYSIGTKARIIKNMLISSDIFYKSQINVAENRAIYTTLSSEITNLKNTLSYNGNLDAFGFELNIQTNTSKFDFESSYTYTHSVTKFADIQDGVPYRTNFLRPHAFSFSVNYSPSNKWDFNIKSLILSGHPFTAPVNAYYDNENEVQLIFKDRNNGRYPNYMRFDVGIVYNLSKESNWSLSIYNVTGNRNPFHIYLDIDNRIGADGKRSSGYYDGVNFTVLPSLAYSRKFK